MYLRINQQKFTSGKFFLSRLVALCVVWFVSPGDELGIRQRVSGSFPFLLGIQKAHPLNNPLDDDGLEILFQVHVSNGSSVSG